MTNTTIKSPDRRGREKLPHFVGTKASGQHFPGFSVPRAPLRPSTDALRLSSGNSGWKQRLLKSKFSPFATLPRCLFPLPASSTPAPKVSGNTGGFPYIRDHLTWGQKAIFATSTLGTLSPQSPSHTQGGGHDESAVAAA